MEILDVTSFMNHPQILKKEITIKPREKTNKQKEFLKEN